MKILSLIPTLIFLFLLVIVQSAFGKDWPGLNLADLNQSQLPPPVRITVHKDPVYQTKKYIKVIPLMKY